MTPEITQLASSFLRQFRGSELKSLERKPPNFKGNCTQESKIPMEIPQGSHSFNNKRPLATGEALAHKISQF